MLDASVVQEILSSPQYMTCTCFVEDCEYHGKCKECVALHRYCGMLPTCLDAAEKEDSK